MPGYKFSNGRGLRAVSHAPGGVPGVAQPQLLRQASVWFSFFHFPVLLSVLYLLCDGCCRQVHLYPNPFPSSVLWLFISNMVRGGTREWIYSMPTTQGSVWELGISCKCLHFRFVWLYGKISLLSMWQGWISVMASHRKAGKFGGPGKGEEPSCGTLTEALIS